VADADDVREALSDPVYETAFDKTLRGQEATWTDDERAAARRAVEVTGTTGPGYPMPWRLDPTRGAR
jgi:hypothetical protein